MDRLTRGNREETTKLEQWAREHGKQLVITGADVHFPSKGNEGIQWDIMLRMAHQEWLSTSERYSRMQRNRLEAGSLVGRAPFGYVIARQRDLKTLKPHPVNAEYVRQAVARCLAGDSLRLVGAWLDSEGIKPSQSGTWTAKSLADLFRNPVLIGVARTPRAALS